jgi:tripartite-type tricarboxylate transporter receptor subunit TctC
MRHAVLGLLALTFAAAAAQAQTFPTMPITFVVPTAPGGAVDALARRLAPPLAERLGQQVIIENKTGANTQIAAEFVAKAAPDGHTLLLGPDVTFTVNPHLYRKLSYDALKDFAPITGLTVLHQALVAHPSLAANSVPELIALAKGKPASLNYGTFGLGSAGHLNMEAFSTAAGITLVPVHYRGAAPAFNDVLAGHIGLMFVSFGSVVETWKAGKVKVLAIGRAARMPDYPDLPTVAEGGLPGFEAKSWFGLFAPAATPRNVVAKINAEVRGILGDTNFRAFLDRQMMESIATSPEDYAELIRTDSRKWGEVIRGAKLQID